MEHFIGQLAIPVQPEKMDKLDKKILYLLSLNCRLSNMAIARHLQTSREVVSYRIQRMMEQEILHGFLTLINAQALAKKMIIVGIKVHASVKIQELLEAFEKHPSVTAVRHCGGIFDVVMTIQANNDEECYVVFHGFLEKYASAIKCHEIFSKLEQHFSSVYLLLDNNDEKKKLEQIQEHKGNSFIRDFQTRPMSTIASTDQQDQDILAILNHDARISLADLSAKTGISFFQLQKRIKSLIRGNIIQAFIPYFSLVKCGFQCYYVFANVRQQAEPAFREWTNQHPSIVWRTKLLGQFNYKLSLYVNNNSQLADILKEMHEQFGEAIFQTESLPVFASSKYISFLK